MTHIRGWICDVSDGFTSGLDTLRGLIGPTAIGLCVFAAVTWIATH